MEEVADAEYDPERDASPPCDSRESGGAGAEAGRGSDDGGRAAKRRRASGVEAPEPDRGLREGQQWGGRVWVWDLDETLILFNSVLTRTFLQHQHLSEAASRELISAAETLEDAVYALAEDSMYFKQLEGRNRSCFAEAAVGMQACVPRLLTSCMLMKSCMLMTLPTTGSRRPTAA